MFLIDFTNISFIKKLILKQSKYNILYKKGCQETAV